MTTYNYACANCSMVKSVPEGARLFRCDNCGKDNGFVYCPKCNTFLVILNEWPRILCKNCGNNFKKVRPAGSTADRLGKFAETTGNIGDSLSRAGRTMTLLVTLPILGFLFFGIPGLVIAIVLALLAGVGSAKR